MCFRQNDSARAPSKHVLPILTRPQCQTVRVMSPGFMSAMSWDPQALITALTQVRRRGAEVGEFGAEVCPVEDGRARGVQLGDHRGRARHDAEPRTPSSPRWWRWWASSPACRRRPEREFCVGGFHRLSQRERIVFYSKYSVTAGAISLEITYVPFSK